MSDLENFIEIIVRLNTFWSTLSYNFNKINEIRRCVLYQSSQKLVIHHYLKMIILGGELMRLIIYANNAQQ